MSEYYGKVGVESVGGRWEDREIILVGGVWKES